MLFIDLKPDTPQKFTDCKTNNFDKVLNLEKKGFKYASLARGNTLRDEFVGCGVKLKIRIGF